MKTKAFPTGRYRSVNMMVYFCRYRYFWFITSRFVQLRAYFDITDIRTCRRTRRDRYQSDPSTTMVLKVKRYKLDSKVCANSLHVRCAILYSHNTAIRIYSVPPFTRKTLSQNSNMGQSYGHRGIFLPAFTCLSFVQIWPYPRQNPM